MSEGELRFDGRVAVITGAGRGIGRAHALALAARGAKIVVNDLGADLAGDGGDGGPARRVVQEIVDAGGEAVADASDISHASGGESILTSALDVFGRVDIVIANAGNLAMDSMPELEIAQLRRHLDVHVAGSFNLARAAWPHLAAQRYGRIVLTTSSGLYGGRSLISYSTAKGGVMSLGRSLASAARDVGIKVNLIAPVADTRMVDDPQLRARQHLPPLPDDRPPDPSRGPDRVSPMAIVLAHESCPVNGEILLAGADRFARLFVAETRGLIDRDLSAEQILMRWSEVVDAGEYRAHLTTQDAIRYREELITRTLP